MKKVNTIVLALVSVCLLATLSATGQNPTLPGVPVANEQHHHLVLQNPYVEVFEVELAPHDTILMHQHLHDYMFLIFGNSDITNAVAGKPETEVKPPDSTVIFSRAPFSHTVVNNSDTVFRNVTIELLHPQGEMKKFYASLNEALASGTPDQKGNRQVGVLETDEMRVVAAGIKASSSWSAPLDGRDRLVVLPDKMHDTSGAKEKNSPFPAGAFAWVPAGKNWSVANKSGQEMKLMVLEFKDTSGKH